MTNCLACGGINLQVAIDLGAQPLANGYTDPDPEFHELKLLYCEDCYHAQLSKFIDPEKLYRHYLYVSGTSNTLREWFKDFAARKEFDLVQPRSKKILDVASNDGSTLIEFAERGWEVLGVDPAENIDTQGIPTLHEFFGETWEVDTKFDLILAFNVLAHGPDPLGMLKGIYNNLTDDGTAYVMTSQASMFDNGQFDTIYHEHHSFFSLKSFQTLANRAGFTDISYEIADIHGGSYLFKLTKSDDWAELPQKRPDFEGFADKVANIHPYKLVGYGAAAKAVVVINSLKQDLAYVVDEAPLKIGTFIPGTKIPIVSPELLRSDTDNLVIIVYAWNFYEEIVVKIKKLRPNRSDVFIRYWK